MLYTNSFRGRFLFWALCDLVEKDHWIKKSLTNFLLYWEEALINFKMLERGIGHFLSWARENGAFLDSRIEFQYSKQKGYSALIHDFLSGEELIKVPKQMVIGPHLKEQYLPGINYAHSDSYFTNNEMTILLISKLAFDTSLNDNRFKQYFEIVPKDFNIPYFWNSNEIDLVNENRS